jgi:hypothetical protein
MSLDWLTTASYRDLSFSRVEMYEHKTVKAPERVRQAVPVLERQS